MSFLSAAWGGISSIFNPNVQVYHKLRSDSGGPIDFMFRRPPILFRNLSIRQRAITTGLFSDGQLALLDVDGSTIPRASDAIVDLESLEIRLQAEDEANKCPPKSGYSFSLSPFSLVLRAVKVPVLGLVDIGIQKALPYVEWIVSNIYHALPLTNFARISRFLKILDRSRTYDPTKIVTGGDGEGKGDVTCDICNYKCRNRKGSRKPDQEWASANCDHILLRQLATHFSLLAMKLRWDAPAQVKNFNSEVDNIDVPSKVAFMRAFGISKPLEVLTILKMKEPSPCVHMRSDHNPTEGVYHVPDYAPDGLSLMRPEFRWRAEQTCQGVRCVVCNLSSLHGVVRPILNLMGTTMYPILVKRKLMTPSVLSTLVPLGLLFMRIRAFLLANCNDSEHHFLTAVSWARRATFSPDAVGPKMIIIVDSFRTREWLLRHWGEKETHVQNALWLQLPPYGSDTSFAGWRLVVAMLNHTDSRLHIVNANSKGYRRRAIHTIKMIDQSWSSQEIGHVWPLFLGNCLIKGKTTTIPFMEILISFALFGDIYGWDELFPLGRIEPTVVIDNSNGLPGVLAPLVDMYHVKNYQVTFHLIDYNSKYHSKWTALFTRFNIYIMKQMIDGKFDDGGITVWHAFSDRRLVSLTDGPTNNYKEMYWYECDPTDSRFHPQSRSGDNIAAEISSLHGGVTFFTFGTPSGDVIPVRAIAKCVARLGGVVTLIHLNTPEEAKDLLTIAEQRGDNRAVALWNRARIEVGLYPNTLRVVPQSLGVLSCLRYSLLPPPDVVRAFKFGDNFVIAIISAMLGFITPPTFSIGAYDRAGYLPRSANGETFLTQRLNTGEEEIGAWWGALEKAPKGFESIPLIPPGNHDEILCRYRTVYCHGGAGIVQTAGVSGCQVIVADDTLDRGYFNPFDAGVGTLAGSNPDNILLALATEVPAYFGVWASKYWFRPLDGLKFYGVYPFLLGGFQTWMLWLVYTRTQKRTLISADPLATFVLLLTGRNPGFRGFCVIYVCAALGDKLLYHTGRNYYWLAARLLRTNITLARSVFGLYIAQTKSLFSGLLLAEVLRLSQPYIDIAVDWCVSTFFGLAHEHRDEVYFEVSPRIYFGVPVIHSALVIPSKQLRYEGALNEVGNYEFSLRPGNVESLILFPTNLTLKNLENAPKIQAPYGFSWHCQTGLILSLRDHLSKMGVGLVVAGGAVLLAGGVLGTFALAGTLLYALVITLPGAVGTVVVDDGRLPIFGDMVRRLVRCMSAGNSQQLLAILDWWRGLTTAFGTTIPDLYADLTNITIALDNNVDIDERELLLASLENQLHRLYCNGHPPGPLALIEYKYFAETPIAARYMSQWDSVWSTALRGSWKICCNLLLSPVKFLTRLSK